MTDIAGLRKRVEAASGPSRELDDEIWRALNFPATAERAVVDELMNWNPSPKLTASLDASLTLCEQKRPGEWWVFVHTAWKSYESPAPDLKRFPLKVLSALLAVLEARDVPA